MGNPKILSGLDSRSPTTPLVAFMTSFLTTLSTHADGMVAMSALALQVDFNFIVDSFPWASYTDPTISKIGGGCGDVSIGFKSHLPSARFIVQDAPERARKQSERIFGRARISLLSSLARTRERWKNGENF